VSQPVVRPDPSLRRFLALLAVAMVLIRTVALMMGPLLISLSAAFHTSMTAAGHLAAAIYGSWALTALLAGPVSDAFGRRRVGLTGLAVMAASLLASSLAWDYGSLLVCRLLTGVGAAMVPPNAMAAIADIYPAARRGRPIGLVISAGFLGPVLALPLVAVLAQVGGWRLPFAAVGGCCALLGALQALGWPRPEGTPRQPLAFRARFAAVARRVGIWPVLGANLLYQCAAYALFTYLTALLIRSHGLRTGDTALPLALAMLGAMVGTVVGGLLAERPWRLAAVTLALGSGGLVGGLAFLLGLAPWLTLLLACGGAVLLSVFEPVSWALIAELAGESRATANGLLATSNQIGALAGSSLGGLALDGGGFPLVGVLGLASALLAALIIAVNGRRVEAAGSR